MIKTRYKVYTGNEKQEIEEVMELFQNENIVNFNFSAEPDFLVKWIDEYEAYFLIQNFNRPPYNQRSDFGFDLIYSADWLMECYLNEVVSKIYVEHCLADIVGKCSVELIEDTLEVTKQHLDYYAGKLPKYKYVAEQVYQEVEKRYYARCEK